MARSMLGLLAGLLGIACAAQAATAGAQAASAAAPSSSVDTRTQLQGAALVRALRQGGLIVYFRHTATDFSKNDTEMRSLDDCERQRPLNDQGRRDARAIGARIATLRLPVGEALASPMCRTMEHATLMLGRAAPTPAMRERSHGEFDGLRRLLSAPVAAGSNRWLVGHGMPFRTVAGPPHLAEGEAAVLQPQGDSWLVLARLAVADWASLDGR